MIKVIIRTLSLAFVAGIILQTGTAAPTANASSALKLQQGFQSSSSYDFLPNPFVRSKEIGGPIATQRKVLSRHTFKNKFIGYTSYPKVWSKASGYTISGGQKLTGGVKFTWKGLGLHVTFNYTAKGTTHFKANQKRASRLQARANVTVEKYKSSVWPAGASHWHTVYGTAVKHGTPTISVIYKK